MSIDLELTPQSQQGLRGGETAAVRYGHSAVDGEHLLFALLQEPGGVVARAISVANGDPRGLSDRLVEALSEQPRNGDGESQTLVGVPVTERLCEVVAHAQAIAQRRREREVSVDHLVLALIAEGDTTAAGRLLKAQGITEWGFLTALRSTPRDSARGRPAPQPRARQDTDLLSQFGRDRVADARAGLLEPVIGRDAEIRRVEQVLSRKTKRNPVLIGDPGVGKTAIVEALAQRIAAGDVPQRLLDKKIVQLDLAAMIAGTRYRGDFEERLQGVLAEVLAAEGQIIIFLDEVHTLVGAGASGDSALDAGSILKPLLARGELQLIGATTVEEYRTHIEKDGALERRFQPILVEEPTISETVAILRGLRPRLEAFHGLEIRDGALTAAAELSQRYVADRSLPDKAIDLVDEACASLRSELDTQPALLDDAKRALERLETERLSLTRERDPESQERLQELDEEIARRREEAAGLEERWESEGKAIRYVLALREARRPAGTGDGKGAASGSGDSPAPEQAIEDRLSAAEDQLDETLGAEPLLRDVVGQEEIARIVARATGIPVHRVLAAERDRLIHLEETLRGRVVGQDEAVELVTNAVVRARAAVQDPRRPIGSFIFLGPTGVGKTELAKALAEALFDSEESIVRLDMSEYQERHTVSRLVGAPPGYVGYGEGGQLTEPVRRKPFSVVLLDEIEKAHGDVQNALLQILDEGRLTDAQGRRVDFRNTVLIMTSNAGSHHLLEGVEDGAITPAARELVLGELRRSFRPEFLNRIDDIVLFKPLTLPEIQAIIDLQFAELSERLAPNRMTISVTPAAKLLIAESAFDPILGARPLRRFIQHVVETNLGWAVLTRDDVGSSGAWTKATVKAKDGRVVVQLTPAEQ